MAMLRSCKHSIGMLLLWAGLLQICAAQSPALNCSGRGYLPEGAEKCVCQNTLPEKGTYAWGGPNCDMPIFGAAADGSDMTAACKRTGCNFLLPNEWMCFSVPFAQNSHQTIWNYLTVQLNRESQDDAGDPDLYGMFYGGAKVKALDRQTFAYDFRETSSSSHVSVVKKVNKADFAATGFDYQGAYLCAKAYGEANLTYSMRATLSICPADFTASGEELLCSSPLTADASQQRYSACLPDGTCACKPPYAKPVENVYPLLGFEDCSAKVEDIGSDKLTLATPYIKQHEQLYPKSWSFYSFDIQPDDYQVVVNVATEKNETCGEGGYFGVFAKYGQPPGWRYGEWDFRPSWDYYSERGQDDLEMRFDATKEAWQTGNWYVGVNGDDAGACKYTISISKYSCPLNCSNRGECITAANNTRTCKCSKGYFGEDCSNEATHLQWGVPVDKEEALFEYDFFQLPDTSPAMLTHAVEVRVTASFSSSGYGQWATARPELLLLKGDLTSQPDTANYTFKQTMQTQNTTYEIDLCPSQLKQGVWRAAIHNPMRIYKIAYNLTTIKVARCLNNCSGHGTCSEDAICHCQDDWTGGDCSVNMKGGCQPGSRSQSPMAEAHGICWHECRCDGAGSCAYDESACADFTCDNPKWRRQGNKAVCVKDVCTQDAWVEEDSFSCLKKCTCPADGSACTLSSVCDAQHFVCKPGYQRFSDGQTKCFKPGCAEGSLQEAVSLSVSNGHAYAICTCSGDEMEGRELCRVGAAEDAAAVMVTCKQGFMEAGGRCVRAARRRSWLTALLAVLWLLLGSIAGAGCLWVWENKFRRSSANAASLYHELSMDTGF